MPIRSYLKSFSGSTGVVIECTWHKSFWFEMVWKDHLSPAVFFSKTCNEDEHWLSVSLRSTSVAESVAFVHVSDLERLDLQNKEKMQYKCNIIEKRHCLPVCLCWTTLNLPSTDECEVLFIVKVTDYHKGSYNSTKCTRKCGFSVYCKSQAYTSLIHSTFTPSYGLQRLRSASCDPQMTHSSNGSVNVSWTVCKIHVINFVFLSIVVSLDCPPFNPS